MRKLFCIAAVMLMAVTVFAPLADESDAAVTQGGYTRMSDKYVFFTYMEYIDDMKFYDDYYYYVQQSTMDVMEKYLDNYLVSQNDVVSDDREYILGLRSAGKIENGTTLAVYKLTTDKLDSTMYRDSHKEPMSYDGKLRAEPYNNYFFIKAGSYYSIAVSPIESIKTHARDNFKNPVYCYIVDNDGKHRYLEGQEDQPVYETSKTARELTIYAEIVPDEELVEKKVIYYDVLDPNRPQLAGLYYDVNYLVYGISAPNGSPFMFELVCGMLIILIGFILVVSALKPAWLKRVS
ncbi:MAG: hypothetical protein IJ856_07635 [Candidatus Methanomethylophilaceae archaeon]|nr:hypothetical protein [Candidatus Methanomethylophilaceae archaeon]